MDEKTLFKHIQQLEVSLHQPDVRSNPIKLEALLHPEFQEIGRSGNRYNRVAIMALLLDDVDESESEKDVTLVSKNFAFALLSPSLVQVTYKSAEKVLNRAQDSREEELINIAYRSSLWQRADAIDQGKAEQWQVRFHQGTPLADY
ncbi:hypothetical protein KIH87_06950 [Paraneptunicella aestuarii]|uniref:nuclear transport factor 2 family protein n=1 Tax=Paraneptunicella aestuarii TaxID=2831148 RepID=UPI001E513419|nr:DUF4440 domain-containing protein [Paraneptunicella aestuarii]UAA40082.1 hypothetical protein KIH87_06950 [Paraneptunicella aestuarii]